MTRHNVWAFAIATLGGLAPSERMWNTSSSLGPGQAGQRSWLPAPQPVTSGPPVMLGRVTRMASGGEQVYALDWTERLVRAFDLTGKELWTFPKRGAFDTGYRAATDLAGAGSELMVVDAWKRRIYFLSTHGEVRRTTTLERTAVYVAQGRRGRTVSLRGQAEDTSMYAFDGAGRYQGNIQLPPSISGLSTVVWEARGAALPGSDSIVAAFLHSGFLGVVDVRQGRLELLAGIEALPFPSAILFKPEGGVTRPYVSPSWPLGALAADADTHFVYVLFGGQTESAGRIIDVYDRKRFRYRGSYLLTEPASAFAVTSHGFVTAIARSRQASELRFWKRVGPPHQSL